ncbi:unnamed protein product [Alternaria alternata]
MLILIAGITGLVGLPCAKAAIARGHKVRGLARSARKLPKEVQDQLEGFEPMVGLHDIAAMDKAVVGVDAIICALAGLPEMFLETQLLLLRAAERAGVKIFHASSWNYDWNLSPGSHEIYDIIKAFAHQAELTSTIKPIYMFTGAIVEWYFRNSPRDWDPKSKTFNFYGPSTFQTRYTTADNIADYTLEAITAPDAAKGGFVCVQSFQASPEDIASAYKAATGGRGHVTLNCLGTIEDAKAKLEDARAKYQKKGWYEYIWYCYQVHIPSRSWDFEPVDVARFPNVKQTSLEDFFRQNPDV